MNRVLSGGPRGGTLRIPSSKSEAHRLLICAALGTDGCELRCDGISLDIAATADCLAALGASVRIDGEHISVSPIRSVPEGELLLRCGESGSTLRFLLPLAGALGARAVFLREGRLPSRPLAPFDAELARHGMTLSGDGARLSVLGRLRGGAWRLPGDVSSQFISALLMALPLLEEDSRLLLSTPLESAPYVAMTERALRLAGVHVPREDGGWAIPGRQRPALPRDLAVEGDWSNAAFFLAMGALSDEGVTVEGLSPDSVQGDRAILALLARFGARVSAASGAVPVRRGGLRGIGIDASQIPDLVPVLSVLAALAEGETRIRGAARLRLKESDRIRSTAALLSSLGAQVCETDDGLVVRGLPSLPGGTVESFADHRIAMAAAAAACGCTGEVRILGAECVAKSYPRFWDDFASLGGLK